MRINWIVRIKNKNFWLAAIPAALLLIKTVLALFGVSFEIEGIGNELLGLVEAVFMFLAVMGVVNDPTTNGFSDSKQALTYDKPKKDGSEGETKKL